ncbi:MAG: amine dehydrogenase large subunit [Myxococcota bacterium]
MRRWLVGCALVVSGWTSGALAQPGSLSPQRVEVLPRTPGAHWVWVEDVILHRTALVDPDRPRFLGMLSSGLGNIVPLFSAERGEIYLPETYYARGTRGTRTDVVTIYDSTTLAPLAEIGIPAERAEHASGVATAALSDDGRFVAVFNLTPATSLSIVDVRERRFVGRVETPGCSLVYAAGPRRFLMLCGDGAALTVSLDAHGQVVSKRRSAPFFDPIGDPVTEKAARWGSRWLFVSFEGVIHGVDVSGDSLRFDAPWSLMEAAGGPAGWRIGGAQHLAVHGPSGRLFVLVHRGGPDTHKQAGTEVWGYDLATRRRQLRIAAPNPTVLFLGRAMGMDSEGWRDGLLRWLLGALLPNPGADRIVVTQDPEPLLLLESSFPATLAVLDARSGEFLRDVPEIGIAGGQLRVP